MRISDRLTSLRREAGLSQGQLAEKSGVSQQLISQIERGLNLSTKHLPALAKALGCGVSDLDPSYGEKFLPSLAEDVGDKINEKGDRLVPVYNVQASAGHGSLVDDEDIVSSVAFPPSYLAKLTRADPRNLAIIGVKGDSMIPSLHDDDIVMLDSSKRDLSYDGLFVIRDDGDGLLVKRIGRASKRGHIMVISDNRDLYPPVERSLSDVEVVGKVLWVGRKV